MTTHSTHRRPSVLALIAAAVLIVSACSASTAAPSPAAPSPVAPSASAVPAPSVVMSTPAGTPSTSSLPAFDANEPLLLFYHCSSGCGEAGGQAGIYVMRLDGTGMERIGADAPGTHKHPDWSPDGQRVVFVEEATGRMWIAHLDGSPSERIAVCDIPGCDYPAWSPDGSRIAFSRYEERSGVTGPSALAIEVLDLATMRSEPVVRLERPLLVDVPRWSPDGSELVVGVDRMDDDAAEIGAAIALVPASGGDLRYLTDFEQFGYNPDWDPTNDRIVFSVEAREFKAAPDPEDATWDLYTIRPDGTDLRQLTEAAPGQRLWNPRWTPDGSQISAADQSTFTGVWVDPATGAIKPFPTTLQLARPQVRPLP